MFNKRAEEFRNLSVRPKEDATIILEYLLIKSTINIFVKNIDDSATPIFEFNFIIIWSLNLVFRHRKENHVSQKNLKVGHLEKTCEFVCMIMDIRVETKTWLLEGHTCKSRMERDPGFVIV